jgi:hypothetical protein
LCRYAYSFGGVQYSGNQIGIETFDRSSRRARRNQELKMQFEEDKPVRVFINPNAPKESALFREVLPDMYFGPAIGFLWFTMLFIAWRRNLRGRVHV